MSEKKDSNNEILNTNTLKKVAEDAANAAIGDAKKEEEQYTADPDFDLDKSLEKQDRYNNEFGYDTGALDLTNLTKEDRDILSETRPIHIERDDIPEETQTIHILTLERQKREKHKKVYKTIIALMSVCIIISIIGIVINSKIKAIKSGAVETPTPSVSTDAVDIKEDEVTIDETNFPDAAFREWVSSSQVDSNEDGMLSPDERNGVIILNVTGDTRYTNVKGIEYFPLLQAINISGTSITELDTSSNTKLKNLDVSSTSITTLDLSENNELTELNLSNSQVSTLTLPEESKVETINTEGTSFECTANDQGIYTGCQIIAQENPAVETSEAVPVEGTEEQSTEENQG